MTPFLKLAGGAIAQLAMKVILMFQVKRLGRVEAERDALRKKNERLRDIRDAQRRARDEWMRKNSGN